MVTKNGSCCKKSKLRNDVAENASLKRSTKNMEPVPKKRRSPKDGEPTSPEEIEEEEELEEDVDEPKTVSGAGTATGASARTGAGTATSAGTTAGADATAGASATTGAVAATGASAAEAVQGKKMKHIRPCICDLTVQQRKRIDTHLHVKRVMQRKYVKRVKEIEEELARLEEERMEREREMQEQEELFGDEYELVGKKKKRKKRSARRASMVSLGVRQVINWHKRPRFEVKWSTASTLRKKYASYCGHHTFPLSPIRPIDFHKEPKLAIRNTVASELRSKVNFLKKKWLIGQEDKRKRFVTPYYV